MKKISVFIPVFMVSILFTTGCINLDGEDQAEYSFILSLDVTEDDTDFTIYCPFIINRKDENISLDEKFLQNIEIDNHNININIEFINGFKMINITGKGDFQLNSDFEDDYTSVDQFALSNNPRPKGYEGVLEIYFSFDNNITANSEFNFVFNFGDSSYNRRGDLSGDLNNVGWQTIEGYDESTLSTSEPNNFLLLFCCGSFLFTLCVIVIGILVFRRRSKQD